MEHAGQAEVVHVQMLAGAFLRHVGPWARFADDGVAGGRSERRPRIDFDRKTPVPHERPDANTGAARKRPHFSGDDRELGGRAVQAWHTERDQRLPRGRRGLPDFNAAAREPGAAARPALIAMAKALALQGTSGSRGLK